jgi:antitoxin VapB
MYVMALSIKSIQAEQLVRDVAEKTGESLTGAILTALQERMDRLKNQRRTQVLTSQLDDILRRVDAMPTLDTRPENEMLGYDDDGLPN